jgi:DnaJ-class molecular chaperone
MSEKDYYKILEIERDATSDVIKKAYRALALKFHPDKNKDPSVETKFKEINLAYETLSDPQKKEQYDNPNPFNGLNMGGGHGHNDIFSQMFSGMGGFGNMNININGQNVNMNRGPQKRSSHNHNIKISLRDSHTGIKKNLKITIVKNCLSCTSNCSRCNGRGIIHQAIQTGPFIQQVQANCNICSGSGIMKNANSSCQNCNGKLTIDEEKLIILDLPVGVSNGHTIKFDGLGEQIKKNGEIPGDLIINIVLDDKDPYFTRENDNLIYKCKLTLLESYIGKILIVPHFDANIPINTNIFGTIDFNKRYHLKGKGLGGQGDLIFQFEYDYKDIQLTEDQRNKLENCFKELNLI